LARLVSLVNDEKLGPMTNANSSPR